mmetsp:Transcript_15605/g.18233  ORF Transcript_15605/g.18233 Transcript_15605/m.18233 type:complete len:139 (-) Transcript_15605:2397-2813(-)
MIYLEFRHMERSSTLPFFFAVMYVIALETQTWNLVYLFFFVGSYAFYFLVLSTLSSLIDAYPEYFFVGIYVVGSPYFWVHSILIATMVFLLEFSWKFRRLMFFPTALDIAVEIDHGHTKYSNIQSLKEMLSQKRKRLY